MSLELDQAVFHIAEEDGDTTVRFTTGTVLTDTAVAALDRRLAIRTEVEERPSVTLDLSEVVSLSSAALGKLLGLNRTVRAVGGRLILVNPSPSVCRVFRLTRLDTVLDVRVADPVAV